MHLEPSITAPLPDMADLSGLKILVVDDSESMQVFVRRLLEISGAAIVHVADGGDQALEHCYKTHYDVLLTDIQMPEQDGHAVLKRLRSHDIGIPAIAMTADPTPSERSRCQESGFVLCLGKPFSRAELTTSVARICGR